AGRPQARRLRDKERTAPGSQPHPADRVVAAPGEEDSLELRREHDELQLGLDQHPLVPVRWRSDQQEWHEWNSVHRTEEQWWGHHPRHRRRLQRPMRAAVTAVLAAGAALVLAPAAGADTAQPVVPRISIGTGGIQGVRNHHGYSMRVDTIALDKLAGANVKLRCLGCKTRRLGHPRHRSRSALKYVHLGWIVGSSNYIEVDISRSGYVGRWLRMGLRHVRHPRKGTSCFPLPGSRAVNECLLRLKTGCLLGATAHSACPSGTPIQNVDNVPGVRLPHTSINSGPTGLSNSRSATFTY